MWGQRPLTPTGGSRGSRAISFAGVLKYWEDRYRDRFTQIAKMPPKPGQEEIYAKLQGMGIDRHRYSQQDLRNDSIYSGLVRYHSEQHPTNSVDA